MYRIVNTDNFCGDYPNEYFLNETFTKKVVAEQVAELLNENEGGTEEWPARRYWRVVEDGYELQPGFEP